MLTLLDCNFPERVVDKEEEKMHHDEKSKKERMKAESYGGNHINFCSASLFLNSSCYFSMADDHFKQYFLIFCSLIVLP